MLSYCKHLIILNKLKKNLFFMGIAWGEMPGCEIMNETNQAI
jgi:hypothetical protein